MRRIFICLIAVLSSFTVLHSGGTDGNGGHQIGSTGEYHYHHGYSAHDHYDMNGDGIVDCPFTFMCDTKSNGGDTDIYSDAKDYDSFEEWSNAHHGISKEQQEEDERKWQAYLSRYKDDESSDNEKKEKPLSTLDVVLVIVIVAFILLDIVMIKDFTNHKHRK